MSIELANIKQVVLDRVQLDSYNHVDENPRMVITIDGDNAIEWFKILLNRAMGNWDNAPWELKEFADQFIDGSSEGKQKYQTQALQTIQEPPKNLHN